jgi:hypothetical protein
MKRTKVLYALLATSSFLVVIYIWSLPSGYDRQACHLKVLAIKGVIDEIRPGHNLTFTIKSTDGNFL